MEAAVIGDNTCRPMPRRNLHDYRRQGGQVTLSVLAIVLVSLVCYGLHFNAATVVLLYLLVIVWQSLVGGFAVAAAVALLAAVLLDYFFLPPLLSLRIADPLNVLAFLVFAVIALVITHLVSRLRAEADRARRRSRNLDQLYQLARQMLLAEPHKLDLGRLVQTLRELFAASAVCLYAADSGELHTAGTVRCGLSERTKQAYILSADGDDENVDVVVRCLRVNKTLIGAIGLEGLPDSEWVTGPLTVFVAAAIEQARAFQRASHEIAAAQAEVFRTAILDALGHEFKTPLATIMAVAGGLREGRSLGPEEAEMAGTIEQEASRLSSLAGRLLRMARLDREELKPRMRSTNMHSLVERIVGRYTAPPHDRLVAVNCTCPLAQVWVDRELLDLAVTQLLDNAFKYSFPGSAVTVTIGEEGEFVAARVRNEGSSIAPEEQERIFERFYRGAGVRKLVSGAGLGLYVARKIAVAHGGSLRLEDSAAAGSVVFCLRLPMLHVQVTNNVLANR